MNFGWNLALGITTCLLGIGMFFLFLSVSSTGWRSISLLFAVTLILLGIFRLLNFFLIWLPEGHCKRLAVSIGIFSAGLFYILYGQSIVWIALAWILVIFGFLSAITGLQGILVETALLQRLLRDYRQAVSPNLPVPFVYILAEPGWGVYVSYRLVTKIINSLWKHRYLPVESRLSVYSPQPGKKKSGYLWRHRQRGMMLFIVSDSVRRYSSSFRKWLAFQAAAFIVVRTSVGVDEPYEKTFNEEAKSGYQICPGPTFAIYYRHPWDTTPTPIIKADQTLECTQGIGDRQFDDIIAPLVNRLAQTALPTAASDAQLTKEARFQIKEIATRGLPPIADCYLRFRLAQSDVERFLSLLDCIESLIRCSAIVLLVNRWNYIGRDVSDKLLAGRPPTLGVWINFLRKLINIDIQNGIDKKLCAFYKGNISQVQAELINEISKTGLPLADNGISSQLNWLEWFRDLRNVTRGHGVVEEKVVAPFWHFFHQAFLDIISALEPLVLSSILVAIEPKGKQVPIQGWYKMGTRTKLKFHDSQDRPLVTALKLPSGQLLPLFPLVIVYFNKVLLWDRLRKREKAIEFLDYGSGEREQLAVSEFSDSDPYKIWKKRLSIQKL